MKMKRLTLITIMMLAIIPVVAIGAVPQMPHQFYGDVTIDGIPAPNGIWVDAYIDGVLYEWTTTSGGTYGWDPLFKVPADDPDVVGIDGGVNGDTIEFYIDGVLADSALFEIGGSTNLDLAITTAIYELQLYEGWNLIGIPCIPEDPSIEVMIYDIIDYVESVWAYDGEMGYWSSYSPYAPSDLTEMVDGKGYWIKMTTDMVWEITIV